MITKRILFLILLSTINTAQMKTDDECVAPTTGAIISDAAAMTDYIAEIIISCKTEKNPQKIKELISKAIKVLANMIQSIIEKRRLKKLNRSININGFDFSEISGQTLEEEIEQMIHTIILKAGVDDVN